MQHSEVFPESDTERQIKPYCCLRYKQQQQQQSVDNQIADEKTFLLQKMKMVHLELVFGKNQYNQLNGHGPDSVPSQSTAKMHQVYNVPVLTVYFKCPALYLF